MDETMEYNAPVPGTLADLTEDQREQLITAVTQAEEQKKKVLEDLAQKIERKFIERAARRAIKENEWYECMKLYLGPLATGIGSTVTFETPFGKEAAPRKKEFNIVRTKCDTAISSCVSMQFSGGEKNWEVVPPTVATDGSGNPIPPEMLQEPAKAMDQAIADALEECGYMFECRKAIRDRVILGTGVLKGPLNCGEVVKKWLIEGSVAVPQIGYEIKPTIEHVPLQYFFPDDTVVDADDAEDAIQLRPMSPSKLRQLLKNPGFMAEVIEQVLLETPGEDYNLSRFNHMSLTNNQDLVDKNKYMVKEYHGPITKDELGALGISPSYESPSDVYYGEVWVVHGKVIRLDIPNLEGCFHIPYAACPWVEDPGSMMGIGLPLLIRDQQIVINAAYAMSLDNSSNSSGPQVVIDKTQIEPADGNWELRPGKIWYMTEYGQDVNKAIQFTNTPNVTDQLKSMMDLARGLAEEESGVPAIAAGMQSPQVTESPTGLAILQQASTTLLDYMSEMWDDRITEKVIRWMYDYLMQYSPRQDIKAALEINVRSSTEYRNKQLFLKDLEKVSVESGQNQNMGKWINQDALQKTRLSMMHLPPSSIIKTQEQVQQEEANKGPDPQMIELMLKEREVAAKEKKLQLDEMRLQFEATKEQERVKMEYQERMANAQVRAEEAQAQVTTAWLNYQTAMLTLAAKQNVDSAKIMAMLDTEASRAAVEKFKIGVDAANKAEDRKVMREEMKLAKTKGEGI